MSHICNIKFVTTALGVRYHLVTTSLLQKSVVF